MIGLFRSNFLLGTAAVPSTAAYSLPIPQDGNYQISLLYRPGKDRASNVPIVIHHADGKAELTWNMRKGSTHGFSIPVGTFRLKAGDRSTVSISTEKADGNVIADAVAFVKVAN
jgi:hypothetical protein